MQYRVDPSIFERVPEFRRGVVVAERCDNRQESPELEALLRNRIAEIAADNSISQESQRIQAWTTLYKQFPSPTGERIRPSIWNLVRRIKRGDGDKLPFVSPLVAISNLVSLTYLVPSGLVDGDKVSGNLVLGFAKGQEHFLAFGREESVKVEAGEVIYYDDASDTVMCRAWNSRGGKSTGIGPDTMRAIIDVDVLLSHVHEEEHVSATEFTAALVRDYCKGTVRIFYLDEARPEFQF